MELSPNYATDAFLTVYAKFKALRGTPRYIYSDKGSQLIKASTLLPDCNWEEIKEQVSRQGTTWRFCPAGCQYRNGLAEARVKALKNTMKHLFLSGAGSLNFSEFQSLLARAAAIINDRPLGVRHHKGAEGELLPLTPNLLLLGRSSHTTVDQPDIDDDTPDRYTKREKFVEEVLGLFWNMWYKEVFEYLFPLQKWKEEHPNLQVGDVSLLYYPSKVKGDYKLCKVLEVETDSKGLVRTVFVGFRPQNSRDKSLPYRSLTLQKLRVGVNRLILLETAGKINSILNPAVSVEADTAASE